MPGRIGPDLRLNPLYAIRCKSYQFCWALKKYSQLLNCCSDSTCLSLMEECIREKPCWPSNIWSILATDAGKFDRELTAVRTARLSSSIHTPTHLYPHQTLHTLTMSTEKDKMLRGELYHAFTPELTAARKQCFDACRRFNNAGEVSRRRLVELWKE